MCNTPRTLTNSSTASSILAMLSFSTRRRCMDLIRISATGPRSLMHAAYNARSNEPIFRDRQAHHLYAPLERVADSALRQMASVDFAPRASWAWVTRRTPGHLRTRHRQLSAIVTPWSPPAEFNSDCRVRDSGPNCLMWLLLATRLQLVSASGFSAPFGRGHLPQ